MFDIELWKVFSALGIPGIALGIYLFLFRGLNLQADRLDGRRLFISLTLFMLLTTFVVIFALYFWKPSSPPNDGVHLKKDLSKILFSVDEDLSHNASTLNDLREIAVDELKFSPSGKLNFKNLIRIFEDEYWALMEFSYGEEKNMYALALKLESAASRLNNIKSRNELNGWNQKFDLNLDDITFINCFFMWYLRGYALEKGFVSTNTEPNFRRKCEAPNGGVWKFRYLDFRGEPPLNFSDFLGLLD
ncbi:MAG: hypothetical protein RIG67_14585 [Rhodospirillales bacterium]